MEQATTFDEGRGGELGEDKRLKAEWDSKAYIMDPYLGLARAQGADARKTGEDSRFAAGTTDQHATLLPRRARKAARPTTCQVDGCGRDLSGEKAYLQRYSVCDAHFKANVAMVHGQEVRFCQQCNKFQDLREFEGVRRSCVARSKDRNLRRRLQTTLQKGGTAEETLMANVMAANMTAVQQQQQQQSGSPGGSGGQAAGGQGRSDDSGGRTGGSGDASVGGSAALARRPEGGSGGSDSSLEAAGAGGLAAAPGPSRRDGHASLGTDVHFRNAAAALAPNPHLQQHQQPSGSGGNGGGASSGNGDAGVQEPRGGAAGPWGISMEHMGQSYDAEACLRPGLAGRRGGAAGGGGGPAMMELDDFIPAASAHPYALAHGNRHQQGGGGHAAAGLALEGGGGSAPTQREVDAAFLRKLAAASGGGDGGGGSWGGPASLSLLDAFENIRSPSHHEHQQYPHHSAPHQLLGQRLALHPGAQSSASPGSVMGGGYWGSGASIMNRQHSSIGAADGGNGLGGQQQQQHQQLTLGGAGEDGSAAALLEQLQGAVAAGMGPRSALAAIRDDLSLGGLLGVGGGGPRGGGGGGAGMASGLRSDQPEGHRAAGNSGMSNRAVLMLQQQQQAGGVSSSLLAGSSGQRQDDLTAMIKERRAALIRQQLLQQQHRQQHQHQTHEPFLPQEHQALLAQSYTEGPSMNLNGPEQLQPRLVANGGGGGSMAAAGSSAMTGLDDYYDVVPTLGGRGGVGGGASGGQLDGGGVGMPGSSRLLGAGSLGAAHSAGSSEALNIMPRQQQQQQPPAHDPGLDTVQLLEHYALGGGGAGSGRLGGGGGVGNGGHLGLAAALGGRGLQQHNTASGGSADGGGGGAFGRYDSGDVGGGAGSGGAGYGAGDRGNDGEDGVHGGAGGSRSVLSVLFPGAGGREDALAARVCLKLFSCVPEDLPGDMLARLRRWAVAAESDVLQIFMRPGCVHLIVNMRLSRGSQDTLERCVLGGGNLDVAVAALRAAFDSSGLLRGRRVVVQAAEGPHGAYEYDGAAGGQAHWVAEADMARAPSVVAVHPAALTCGVPTVAVLAGRNLLRPGTRYYARCGNRSYELRPLVPQPSVAAAATSAGVAATAPAQPSPLPPPPPPPPEAVVEAAPRLCSSGVSPVPWAEVARGSWTGCASSPPSSSCLLGGGEGAISPLDESDLMPRSWTSPCSSNRTGEATRGSAGILLADVPPMAAPSPLPDGGAAAAAAVAAAAATAAAAGLKLGPWSSKAGPVEVVFVQVPAMPRHGLLVVEAACSEVDVMGAWAPGLVCQDAEAAEELNAWARNSTDLTSCHWLLKEMGVLLDYDAALPTLLHEPVAPTAAAGAARRGDGPTVAPAGGDPGDAIDAVSASMATLRGGSHQRGGQQQQQQHVGRQLPQQRAVTNPLLRHAAADQVDMAAVAAAAGAGALSAVPYMAAAGRDTSPTISARPGGFQEHRLPSSAVAAAGGATLAGGGPVRGRGSASSSGSGSGGVAPHGAAAAAAPEGLRSMAAPQLGQPNRLFLSDDTKVPDAPGRLLGNSLRRLLSHPLLHPSCRRAMRSSGTRLLAFAVASGLGCLATGLLEWLLTLEAPGVGQPAGGSASTASGASALSASASLFASSGSALDSEPMPGSALAELFGRVVSRAAVSTVRGAAVGAAARTGGLGGSWSIFGVEPYFEGESSLDSSIDTSSASSGTSHFRNLSAGLSLLHLAVASCSTRMVMTVLDWATEYGRPWPMAEQSWPGRVTPLHLAVAAGVLRRDGGDMARLLLSLGREAREAWLQACDAAGRTPSQVAHAVGLDGLNYFCLVGQHELAIEGDDASVEGAPTADCSACADAAVAAAPVRVAVLPRGPDLGAGGAAAGSERGPAPRLAAALGLPLLVGALLVVLLAVMLRQLQALGASAGSAALGLPSQ